MSNTLDMLAAPFPPIEIQWRVGSTNADKTKGLALAYLDARNVMQRLDSVVGPHRWQCRYPFVGCCEIGICLYAHDLLSAPEDGPITELGWIWKANGAGQTDIEAEKGQYSDAFKRAAVLWGIGRYLYDLPSPWVTLKDRRIPDEVQADLMQRLAKWQEKRFGEQK
jgi:hypothetical protein